MHPTSPYREPCWPNRPARPKLRRFSAARAIPAQCSLLLTATVYLLLAALYVEHPLVLALRMGLRMPDGCGCLVREGPKP